MARSPSGTKSRRKEGGKQVSCNGQSSCSAEGEGGGGDDINSCCDFHNSQINILAAAAINFVKTIKPAATETNGSERARVESCNL
jgi:hypothetical protein